MDIGADLATQVTLPWIVDIVQAHVQIVHGAVSEDDAAEATHHQAVHMTQDELQQVCILDAIGGGCLAP